tara:strand:- start:11812 stop:12204 length:393 start_codon:yes stop_codon:yes gene_type:complete
MDSLIVTSIAFIAVSSMAFSGKQSESIPFQEFQDDMRKEGQFLTVHLSLGNPIRVFIVGKEEAKIDVSKLDITIRRLNPYPGKLLKLDRYDNYVVVNDLGEMQKDAELEIKLKSNDKTENFKFKLKQKVP